MAIMNYKNIARNTSVEFGTGGYQNVFYFCPRADFLVIQKPITTPLVLGDALEIVTAHTFTSPKGFLSYACKTHSVNLKGATVGEDSAKEIEWTGTFGIIGDASTTQEQLMRILNDDIICLLKDAECAAATFIQLGNECVSPEFDVAFDSKTTKEGKKEYVVTVKCKKKYFYSATVTASTESES